MTPQPRPHEECHKCEQFFKCEELPPCSRPAPAPEQRDTEKINLLVQTLIFKELVKIPSLWKQHDAVIAAQAREDVLKDGELYWCIGRIKQTISENAAMKSELESTLQKLISLAQSLLTPCAKEPNP
jgi:hypothetical protein